MPSHKFNLGIHYKSVINTYESDIHKIKMIKARTSGKPGDFTPVFRFMQPEVRAGGEARGFSVFKVLTHWAEIVGEDIAEKTVPVSISYGKKQIGATLVILTRGSFALMIEMQKDTIIEKVNACYGYRAINRVKITQTAPTGFQDGQVAFRRGTENAKPIDPQIKTTAQKLSSDVRDDKLKNAIEQLSISFLTKLKSR